MLEYIMKNINNNLLVNYHPLVYYATFTLMYPIICGRKHNDIPRVIELLIVHA